MTSSVVYFTVTVWELGLLSLTWNTARSPSSTVTFGMLRAGGALTTCTVNPLPLKGHLLWWSHTSCWISIGFPS